MVYLYFQNPGEQCALLHDLIYDQDSWVTQNFYRPAEQIPALRLIYMLDQKTSGDNNWRHLNILEK